MLFNEPKLLKSLVQRRPAAAWTGFSALQRAEIAEMFLTHLPQRRILCFSALQRAEIAEILRLDQRRVHTDRFSALQRAEIAEITGR